MMNIKQEEITYYRAGIEDVETLIEFRILFLSEFFGDLSDDLLELKKNLSEYFTSAIQSDRFISWLAKYNGEVIGCGGMSIWETIPGAVNKTGKRGYILNMYTIPEARRFGICTELFSRLIKDAKSSGLGYLHLRAGESGINIYRKAGFKEPGHAELGLRLI